MRIRALVLPRFHGITRRLRSELLDGEVRTVDPTYGGLHMRRVVVVGGAGARKGAVWRPSLSAELLW